MGKTKRRSVFNMILLIAVLCAILFSNEGIADDSGVVINAFKVVSETPEFVGLELAGSNDGSWRNVCISAQVKSRDGAVRNEPIDEVLFPQGRQASVEVQLPSPMGLGVHQTELLLLKLAPCLHNRSPVTVKFDWIHTWPAKAVKAIAGVSDNFVEFSARYPWQVFNESFDTQDFAALDSLLTKWNTPDQRDLNGDWKLESFLRTDEFQYRKNPWKQKQVQNANWKLVNSKSVGAYLAEAVYWQAYAANIKGPGNKLDQDPVIAKAYKERFQRAEQALIDSKEFASINPLWYEVYMQIARNTERDTAFIQKLFNESVAKHPYYQPLYLSMLSYLTNTKKKPDWAAANKVIELAVKQTSAMDGVENYAKLYSQLAEEHGLGLNLFSVPYISWPKMKESFVALIAHYPSSRNYNTFALFSCQAGDKVTYSKLRQIVVENYDSTVWPNNFSLDICDHKFLNYAGQEVFIASRKAPNPSLGNPI